MFPEARFIDTNGIRLAVYEQGSGVPVILLHGFPELAYSWRHQFPALADAGYHAIAPDLRGYGASSTPKGVGEYSLAHGMKDVEGLLDALGLPAATFIGHDWGALLLWQMALLAPSRIERMVVLNVPLAPRPPVDPIDIMRRRFTDRFYIVDFQDSDAADRMFDADPRRTIDRLMRKDQLRRADFDRLPSEKKILSLRDIVAGEQASGNPLLDAAELDYYAAAFSRSGFSGPVNWYRNWTRNWKALAAADYDIRTPVLFIGAMDDVLIPPEMIENMRPMVRNLELWMLEPCGHWTQQERPADVNRLIVDWLDRTPRHAG